MNLDTEKENIRKSMVFLFFNIHLFLNIFHFQKGLCQQKDILYDNLTVKEHLEFFCKMKGVLESEIQE